MFTPQKPPFLERQALYWGTGAVGGVCSLLATAGAGRMTSLVPATNVNASALRHSIAGAGMRFLAFDFTRDATQDHISNIPLRSGFSGGVGGLNETLQGALFSAASSRSLAPLQPRTLFPALATHGATLFACFGGYTFLSTSLYEKLPPPFPITFLLGGIAGAFGVPVVHCIKTGSFRSIGSLAATGFVRVGTVIGVQVIRHRSDKQRFATGSLFNLADAHSASLSRDRNAQGLSTPGSISQHAVGAGWRTALHATSSFVENLPYTGGHEDLGRATAQWRYGWASPESVPTFNDSAWTVCNNNSVDPINSILDADTYGYHVGSIWYRGEFTGSACIKGMTLSTQGGNGYGYSVWVNGEFLGGYSGTGASNTNYFNFTSIDNSTNVVSLLVFTTGHDESEGGNFYNYRGLGSAHLIGSQNKITWKVQGNNGGEDILDTVRGPLNEGCLYGERAGWHMPGFPIPSDCPTVTLPYNFATPQVAWFITTFDLNVPKGVDQPIGVQVTDSSRKPYRALLFLNGWQFGRYANDLGPQTLFYVPEGILNYAGNNTIVVAVMSLDSSAVIAPKITLSTIDITTTDIAVSLVDSPAYTPRAGYGSGTIPSKPPAPSPIPTAQNSTAAGCPYTGIVDTSLTYTITVGGVNGCGTVYNYLSGYICDNTYPYGQNGVDFWSADDGSGRQRWNFVEVPGKVNTYNVIVNGRAGCNTTYLSSVPCTGNNNTVELWTGDDGSSLQQWTVTPAANGYNFVKTSGRAGCYDYLSAWPCSTSKLATMYSGDDGSGRQEFVLTPV